MRTICLKFVILITIIGFSTIAHAWKIQADFEGGDINSTATTDSSGFDACVPKVVFSSLQSASGEKSALFPWETGNISKAARFLFPSDLVEGDEIWYRGYFYFAEPWSFSCSPVSKVMRIKLKDTSSDGNAGYFSILFDSDGSIVKSNEPAGSQVDTGVSLPTDKWVCLEIYVKFSRTSPVLRIWKDGVLATEDTTNETWTNAATVSDYTYVMGYWNGGAPQTQNEFVDSFVITNETPSNKDSKGNYMIGPVDYNDNDQSQALEQPINLQIIDG